MKAEIHPEYETTRIVCACGRVTETRGTVEEYHVEICSHCHPFFTGKQKLVDTAGRVERFLAKYSDSEEEAERLAEEAQERAATSEKLESEPTEEELEAEAEAEGEPSAEVEPAESSEEDSDSPAAGAADQEEADRATAG